MILIQIILIINNYLLEELIQKKTFNEWGALLLHEEILDYQKTCEQFFLIYQSSDNNNKEECDNNYEDEEGFLSMRHRNHFYIKQSKVSFSKLMKIMKILTLDAPGDIRRYHYLLAKPSTQSSTSSLDAFMATSTVNEKENMSDGLLLSEEELRFYLSRRSDFSKDAIQRVKLSL